MLRQVNLTKVRLSPAQQAREIPSMLAAMNVALIPGKGPVAIASAPTKIFKLMAGGRTVHAIAPFQSEIARVMESADCGSCTESGDWKDLAEGFHRAYAHREKIDPMGRHGREYMEEHFSRRIWAAQIAHMLPETAGMGQ